jgi:type II secretory pathway pseudopilin PulG
MKTITFSRKGGPSGPPFRFLRRRLGAGYSITELTLLLLAIGLVAAAVPFFVGSRQAAQDAEAKADARTAESAALQIAAQNGGRFNGAHGVTPRSLVSMAPDLVNTDLPVPIVHPQTFTIRVKSGSGNVFDLKRSRDGSEEATCSVAGTGGCPRDGTW